MNTNITPALEAWLSAHKRIKAFDARVDFPMGRASVGTINARWLIDAKEVDRLYAALSEEEKTIANSMIREGAAREP